MDNGHKGKKGERFEMKIDRSREQFEELTKFCEENKLVEPCVRSGHSHAPGDHVTISEKGAALFDILAQFVGAQQLSQLAMRAVVQAIVENEDFSESDPKMN
jgi:endonuclease IV